MFRHLILEFFRIFRRAYRSHDDQQPRQEFTARAYKSYLSQEATRNQLGALELRRYVGKLPLEPHNIFVPDWG